MTRPVIAIYAAAEENRSTLALALVPLGAELCYLAGLDTLEVDLVSRVGEAGCSLLIIDTSSESPDVYGLLNRVTANAKTAQLPLLWLAPSLSSVQRRLHQELLYGICVLIKPCPPERITTAAAVCLQQDEGLRQLQGLHAGGDWQQTMQQGLLGLGEDGRIRYANRAASQLLHISPLQLTGLYIQSLMEAPVTDLLPSRLPPAFAEVVARRQPVELAQFALWRGDGRNLLCHAAIMLSAGSNFALLCAFRRLPPRELNDPEADAGQLPSRDLLTGLPTVVGLEHVLVSTLKREQTSPALLVMDIDHLRHINETLGYALGDQLVQVAASRLHQAMAGAGVLFRIGGDRFAVLVDRVADFRDAGRLAQRCNAQFRPPFLLAGNEVYCGLSVGVALYPGSGDTAESLLRSAEVALEKAKALGRNIVQFYSAELNRHSLEQLERETALHRLLAMPELPLSLLPWLKADGQGLALSVGLDWQPPGLPGADAESVAEESGLVCPLSRRLLQQALARADAFAPLPEGLRLMFSVSGTCLRDPRIVSRVTATIAHHHWNPRHIQLNVVQDDEDWTWMEPLLLDLSAFGVCLGLCLSRHGLPLEALSRLPWKSLVLAPGLLSRSQPDTRADAVLAGMVSFAHRLDLQILAAGVVSNDQARHLFDLGVDACSGPALGGALDGVALKTWLAALRTVES